MPEGGAKILSSMGRSFGLESKGATQVRGSGRLDLHGDRIRFKQWLSRKPAVEIPLTAIIAIESPRGHLGKTSGRRLLRVRWTREDGAEESIAWEVADLDAWIRALAASAALSEDQLPS